MITHILSIAGSDPSGGAGIQADLKTFSALGCFGMAAITALTAQNTQGVCAVHTPEASFLGAQIEAIFADIRVDAIKIGMLGTSSIVCEVANQLKNYPRHNLVVDPVLVATSGDSLGAPGVPEAMISQLLPLAGLITPNLAEAARLSGLAIAESESEIVATGQHLLGLGARAVLIKGGHLPGEHATDLLITREGIIRFECERILTQNTHGTGCTLSAAIAAYLGQGLDLPHAIQKAKSFLTEALRHADQLNVGHGHGPVHHGWSAFNTSTSESSSQIRQEI